MGKLVSDAIEIGSYGLVQDPLGIEAQQKAAQQSAAIQAASGHQAINALRGDSAPFREVGTEAVGQLMDAVLQAPESASVSAQDILSDPFFSALAEQQQRDVLAERAALGLAGSGGTEDLLTRNLLQLGEGFRSSRQNQALQQQQARFNQLFNISSLGQSSAAQTGVQTAGLLTDIGAAQSAVPLAQAQAQGALTSDIFGLAGAGLGAFLGGPAGASIGGQAGRALGGGSAVGGFSPIAPAQGSLASFGVR
jgi:hypothetical protein